MKVEPNIMILIDGEPKTLEIESITKNSKYDVHFKNNAKTYSYRPNRIIKLTNPQSLELENSRVLYKGKLQKKILEIWCYKYQSRSYWHIKYSNGKEKEFTDKEIEVITSCLDNKKSKNTFSYFKEVARINPLGKEESESGILENIYNKLDFIDKRTAAFPYINPSEKLKRLDSIQFLIYPFGCNESQKMAVETSFFSQISVIEGPPGTGKTQTILSIIANIVMNGQTVLVVSNNNSAILNIQEKLEKYNLSFNVAFLGKKENKEEFLKNQPCLPKDLSNWNLPISKINELKKVIKSSQQKLEKVYSLQNEKAILSQEQQALELEWKHFCIDNKISDKATSKRQYDSSKMINLWLKFQYITSQEKKSSKRFVNKIELLWLRFYVRYVLKLKIDKNHLEELTIELQTLFYLNRLSEITKRKNQIEKELSLLKVDKLMVELQDSSMLIYKAFLAKKYNKERQPIRDIREDKFLKDYPIVLSTAFSARNCLCSNTPFDYVIMDESSQVSLETGMLALTCAKNAIIVGDSLQLPNVISNDIRDKLNEIMITYEISDNYDCTKSFLDSICKVLGDTLPKTFLKEHYRCHPKIINYCNQKFYHNKLLVMTKDNDEQNVLCAYKTKEGNHARDGGRYNQREIDVIIREVLPQFNDYDSIGIIAPYNIQVNHLRNDIPGLDIATIHKFQGREKDVIIMSVVDNQINQFVDDPNMLNVAVSRAKKKFCIVFSGNRQDNHGNIMDLLDYISYNNCEIIESQVSSIFDYLYEQYTNAYLALMKNIKRISQYDSENLTYSLISDILASEDRFSSLKVFCHIPLWQIIKDKALMNEEELRYASNFHTHVDFLIANKLSKKPVLAIETDGYAYHNEKTMQHSRDELKNNIFKSYKIPLLRLSTTGSNEKERIIQELRGIRYL